jgi:hypothetical protein
VGHWAGWFRAPRTGNYTFVLLVDDVARLWIGRGPASAGAGGGNTSRMDRIVDVTQWSPRREWYESLARSQSL